MPKLKVVTARRRKARRRESAELPTAVEGYIAEICRDLAVQLKRMRQVQEQADELRLVIRAWASQSASPSDREPANREGRR